MTNVADFQMILDTALSHHQAGRFAQAEALYHQILAADPNQPDALHLLGVVWHQTGRSGQALELIHRSVSINPTFASLNNLGDVLRSFGRVQEAIACFNRALQLNPESFDAYANLSLALTDLGNANDAEKCLTRACQLAPNNAEWHARLCKLRHSLGDFHGAAAAARKVVELAPNAADAWANLSLALTSAKKFDQALDAAHRAVALAPNGAGVCNNLGYVLERAGRVEEAEAAYQKAIELNPSFNLPHRNLAAMYDGRDDPERAVAHLNRSLELLANDLDGWVNLSNIRRRAKDYTGALAAADRAIQMDASNPNAHGNRGLALLSLGDYKQGFAEYEWRWRCDNFSSPQRDFAQPMWDGSDPTGRIIYVHTEQGYGDTLQFSRYVPMLVARGATVYFEVVLPLRALMQNMKGPAKIITGGAKPPDFDLHVPLLSLPRIFGTTMETLPNEVPYLSVDAARQEKWKSRLASIGSGKKIGLVWAGNVKPDSGRTCPLENLAPLAQIPELTFISLQSKENPRGDDAPPAGMKLHDVSQDLKDFAETAAAMMNLDLIITIDTAAAHLAGALGRPAWVLLPFAADWRWMEDREDSPWYPTLRLFRQSARGDWAAVGKRVAEELGKWAGAAS